MSLKRNREDDTEEMKRVKKVQKQIEDEEPEYMYVPGEEETDSEPEISKFGKKKIDALLEGEWIDMNESDHFESEIDEDDFCCDDFGTLEPYSEAYSEMDYGFPDEDDDFDGYAEIHPRERVRFT